MFDISELEAEDTAEMAVVGAQGKVSTWIWTFAGPGHPRTIAQSNRIAREELHKKRLKEQARANAKKWKEPEQSPDEVLAENIEYVMERLLGWSETSFKGEAFPFNEDNARKLLADRKYGALLQQSVDFLLDDASFMKTLAKS